MKTTLIEYSDSARGKLLDGVVKLSNAVTSTLGPNGRNVIIEQELGNPVSTKDGVTVAKSVYLEDRTENIGAQLVKQAAIRTADQAGDGTTTSTLLAATLFDLGLAHTEKKYINVVQVKRGIDKAVKDVIDYLRQQSIEITDENQLKQVATISANNDSEVGELIATAMEKVGLEGVITVEESRTGETYLETVEGMQFNRGYKSPYFVTDNASMTAILKEPVVLITDKRITSAKELLPLLEACSAQNKSLLIVADDIDGEALSLLVVNKARGIIQVVAVKAPEFGDRKKAVLEDIAVLTGGQVISTDKGMRLDKIDMNWLGRARKVTVGKETTTIVDGKGSEDSIQHRVTDIKAQIDNSTSPFEKEQLQDRLGRLVGGVAIVHVGGMTEVEMKEKKDRVEDALHATRAALEEGILPGGGIALLRAFHNFSKSEQINATSFGRGYKVVLDAISMPFTRILINAGYTSQQISNITDSILLEEEFKMGYNLETESLVNMVETGILDPTKVTRLALENAASVAGTMLTTECVIGFYPEEKNKDQQNVEMY
jgi:chaperonin GroEL